MRKGFIALVLLMSFVLTMISCGNGLESPHDSLDTDTISQTQYEKSDSNESNEESTQSSLDISTDSMIETSQKETGMQTEVTITVGKATYTLKLDDTETALAFKNLLPATFAMQELNGNEKFVYLDSSLPTDPTAVESIQAGDLMLYGNNCLVLFYESFATSYSYTRIGHISDISGLAETLGSGNISAVFSIEK